MAEKKVFCENCRADTGYVIDAHRMNGTIREKEYSYLGTEARCKECGELVYVPELSDENLRALYDVYREENGIVSLKAVQSIPKKYNIGKRPLSLLLGWGEHTLSRYLDGDIPTRQYSNVLKRIAEDPAYYLGILEENKDKLQSEIAYRKSKKAAEDLLSTQIVIDSKMDHVIAYLLNRCEDITPLALQKALYYIQGFFYAFFGSFLFEEDCQAWAHGPVYKNIYARYADYRFDPISKVKEFDASVFTSQEKAVLDSVIQYFCCYSGKVLEGFTHSEAPWLITRGEIPNAAPSDRVIEKQLIGDYFCRIKEKYGMMSPADMRSYAAARFTGF